MPKREPKKCLECKKFFPLEYANSTKKTCSPECKIKRTKRLQKAYRENKNSNPVEDFSKGKIFTLDMSVAEEEWTWKEENRGSG